MDTLMDNKHETMFLAAKARLYRDVAAYFILIGSAAGIVSAWVTHVFRPAHPHLTEFGEGVMFAFAVVNLSLIVISLLTAMLLLLKIKRISSRLCVLSNLRSGLVQSASQ